jgi:nucleoside phosphorylase
MEPVAFIAAMSQEVRPLLRRIGPNRSDRTGSFTCFSFELGGGECILLQTGVGIERAKDGARALLSVRRPGLVVSFGIAGAPQQGLEVGDVVVARSVRQLEAGSLGPARPLAPLSSSAYKAVEAAARQAGASLFRGNVITTRGEQSLAAVGTKIDAPVLEMETAGIADVCAEAGIPLLSLRAISDSVREPLPFNLADYLDDG